MKNSLETRFAEFDWAGACTRLLRAEIAREGITLAKLATRLRVLGIVETEASIKNKLYRGTFTMIFFSQCLRALGGSTVAFGGVLPKDMPGGSDLDRVSLGALRPGTKGAEG